MIRFQPLSDENLILRCSPLARGIYLLMSWIAENGPIPLTPSKAFKRVFVDWAAHHFEWPGYRATDLYQLNKVLNEHDMLPLMVVHDLMLDLKLARHYKGAFALTKLGKALVGRAAAIFDEVVPSYILDFDHAALSRFDEPHRLRQWDGFLNVMNVELQEGASGAHLREVFFGPPEPTDHPGYDVELSDLRLQVMRPLMWAGLVQKAEGTSFLRLSEETFFKTDLWPATLELDTDEMLETRSVH